MRRLHLLFACVLASCGSVKANPDAGPEPDGGGSPVDGGGGGTPDATVGPGLVRITTFVDGVPAAGQTVVFMAPDGTLVAQETTNAMGVASAEVEAGADVHALLQTGERDFETFTILDVVPGDDLEVGEVGDSQNLLVGSLNVTLPGGPFPMGASEIRVELGCTTQWLSLTQTTTTIDLYDRCIRAGNVVSVVANVVNGSGDALAYTAQADVNLSGSPLTASVTLPAWRFDFAERDVIVNNAPANLLGFEIQFQTFAHGHGFSASGPTSDAPPPAGGSGSYDFWFAPGVADSESFSLFMLRGTDVQRGASIYLRGNPTLPPTSMVNLPDVLMPLVHSTQFLGGDIIWDSEGEQTDADAVAFMLFFSRGTFPDDFAYRWTILAPPSTPAPFVLPTLPAGFTDRAPQPADNLEAPQVIFIDVVGDQGYDDYRRGVGIKLFSSELPGNLEFRASFAGPF